jgi:exonuclease III
VNRKILELADVMNPMDLIDIYRSFHPNTKVYTFFSAHQGTFSKVDHILSHKASLNRYNAIERTPPFYQTATN